MNEKQRKIIENRELHKAVFLAAITGGYREHDNFPDMIEDALFCADKAVELYRYPGDE